MKITPLDIRRQEFNRKVRGLDPDEVEAFLETVADAFETVSRENAALKDQISKLESQVAGFRDLEQTLQDTLVSAQKARDEAKSDASKEAECIVREAELKAERWIEEARQEVMSLKRELAMLHNHKATFIAKLRALLNAQNDLINVLELDAGEDRTHPAGPPQAAKDDATTGNVPGDERTPSSTSDQPDNRNHADGPQEQTDPSPSPGPAEGPRRPYRRFFGGRHPQGEGQGPAGEG